MAIDVKLLPRAEKIFLALPEWLQDEILNKLEMLKRFPDIGPKMDKPYEGYRCLLAGKHRYRLIYKRASANLINVAYIRHCRRQLGLRAIVELVRPFFKERNPRLMTSLAISSPLL